MLNVATALNQKYIPYTVVMLASLCKNQKEKVRAFLLNHELSDEDVQEIRKALEAYEIEIVSLSVDKALFAERLPRSVEWSVEMYYRLLLLDLLPEEVERLLYLDVDIIINGGLREFYDMDLTGYDMAVCENANGYLSAQARLGDKQKEMFAPMFEQGFKYFNSGVLLMNIKDMRNKYNFQTYLQAFEEWNYQMGAPDQDILNYIHWNRVKYLDSKKYNYFSRIAYEQGMDYEKGKRQLLIIHYTDEKPWETKNYHHPVEQIWWDYAKETPYYIRLLEEFQQKTMFDDTVERWIRDILASQEELQNKFTESLELNQKLYDMIVGGQEGRNEA